MVSGYANFLGRYFIYDSIVYRYIDSYSAVFLRSVPWYLACFSVLAYLSVLAYMSVLAYFYVLAYFTYLACLSVLAYFCVLAYFGYLACLRHSSTPRH